MQMITVVANTKKKVHMGYKRHSYVTITSIVAHMTSAATIAHIVGFHKSVSILFYS